jgi:hypothetical protein
MAKTKSTAKTSQSSVTTDNKVVASDNAITATGGSTINFLSKDVAMGALETAADLGKSAISFSGDALTGILDLADKNAAVTEASRIGNNNLAQSLAETAIQNVKESAQSDQIQLVTVIAKYGAIIVGALVVVFFLFRKSSSK